MNYPICKPFLQKNRVATHRPSCHWKFGFQFSFFQFFYICCRNLEYQNCFLKIISFLTGKFLQKKWRGLEVDACDNLFGTNIIS